MEKSKKELEFLMLETLSLNEETLETLELLTEELDMAFSFNLTSSTILAH